MPAHATASAPAVKLATLAGMKSRAERIAMLTAYDATLAAQFDAAGIDVVLVGDSLGMVVQGRTSTVPVMLDEVAYHLRCVAAGNRHAWLLGDLPFGTYEAGPEQALRSSATLLPLLRLRIADIRTRLVDLTVNNKDVLQGLQDIVDDKR